jgi:ribA/ribD-fused uncharacterized protein
MAFIDTSDLAPQAWERAAAIAVPLFAVGNADVYAFPPMLTQANLKQGYVALFLLTRSEQISTFSQPTPGIECAMNGYYSPFRIGGQQFPTVEHFFQASKFHPHSPSDVAAVLAAPPDRVAEIGRDPRRHIRPDWDAVRDAVMLKGLREKFLAHPEMLTCLRKLGTPTCHGADDPYWGLAPLGYGRNRLWELLCQIMGELPDLSSDPGAPIIGRGHASGVLVRGKISCASTKVAYQPPHSLGPATGLDPQMYATYGAMGEAISKLLCGCSGRRAIGPVGGYMNTDGPVFLIETEDPDDPSGGPGDMARHETILVQTYLNEIDTGKAGRSILQQLVLEGMSAVRQALKKDKQLPYSRTAMRRHGALFGVVAEEMDDDGLVAEIELLQMRPMLAQDGVSAEQAVATLKKRKISRVFIQPKLDGMRLLAFESGPPSSRTLMMITRQGTVHPIAAEFEKAVLPVLANLRQRLGLSPAAALSLDGELYVHMIPAGTMTEISMSDRDWQRMALPSASKVRRSTAPGNLGTGVPGGANVEGSARPCVGVGPLVPIQLNKITGAASSYGKGGLAGQRNASLVALLEYHVFTFVVARHSVLTPDGPVDPALMTAWDRYALLSQIIGPDQFGAAHYTVNAGPGGHVMVREGPRVRLVPALSPSVLDAVSLEAAAAEAVRSGYEGVMIYNADGAYETKRSWNLIKLKATETEWFQVTGTVQERNLELANIRYLYGGQEYRTSGFFSDAVKSLMYRREDLFAGRWALIRFQKITQEARNGGGALRDPKVICIADVREGDPIDLEALAAAV